MQPPSAEHPLSSRSGPRLVRPDQPTPLSRPARTTWKIAVAAAIAVGALVWGAYERSRATALESRVVALSTSLTAARAELTARRQQLDAIRTSVADVRERVGALESLAGADPAPAAPAEAAPGH